MLKYFFIFLFFFFPTFAFAQDPFQVQLTSNQTVSVGVWTPIAFDTVDFGDGDYFSYSSPTSTVLQSGFYLANISLTCNPTANCYIALVVNNSFYYHIASEGGVIYNSVAGSVLLYLEAGDEVTVRGNNGSNNTFIGTSAYRRTSLSLSPIAADSSEVIQTVDNPALNLGLGIFMFFIMLYFLVWYFRGKAI